MTTTELSTNGHHADELSDEDARALAREAYRASGGTLTGAELGERFGLSDRWGRKQIKAARSEGPARAVPGPPTGVGGTGAGTAGEGSGVRAAGMPSPRSARRNGTATTHVSRVTARSKGRQGAAVPEPDVLDRHGRPLVSWGLVAIALLISYSHMRHLAELAGVSWAPLVPLVVDGLMAAALLCLRRHRGYWPARLALAFSVAATLALNGLAERPDLVAMADVRLGWALLVPATAAFGVHLVGKR
jgi:hypothetical protein